MTIEDWISKASIEERNYPAMSGDYHNLAQWLEELQGLRTNYCKQKEINLELVEENEELKNQNAELKRLLKLAVEDLNMLARNAAVKCRYDIFITKQVKIDGIGGSISQDKWRYSNEAKGLIENGNEVDTV